VANAIERATGIHAMSTGDVDATTDYLVDHLGTGDAVLVMGAGKSYRIARGLADRLVGPAA
jgi:D-arabinose 5-phosphate isomerase GutQ